MIRRPPRSTLFPTRRSSDLIGGRKTTVRLELKEVYGAIEEAKADVTGLFTHHKLLDRKSTRLNSSHRCISYAVFCLKKKNKQSTHDSGHETGGTRRLTV